MSLASGSRLGPCEILAPIGAGGMGEVYKAKDTRLDRTVAVKVLAAYLSPARSKAPACQRPLTAAARAAGAAHSTQPLPTIP